MKNNYKAFAAAAVAALFLAACGSSGGLGDILGGGGSRTSELRGTVEQVDLSARSILLSNVTGYQSMLSGGGNSVRVYFDNQTTVQYQGQSYRPEDLERGDQVAVLVDESGNRLMAEQMTVLHDVSGGASDPYGTTVRGTVRNVDTLRRTIEVDRGFGQSTNVEYDTNTRVSFGGQTYRPEDLERGDEIEIRTTTLSGGRIVAQDVNVLRSVSGASSASTSTIRGTVRYIDTGRRLIELEQASYISGFNSGGTTGRTFVISYDANASVDYQGQLHPVTNLERGDVIDVQVQNLGGSSLLAQRIFLVRDVNLR
jgi:hypothetical protein